MKRVLSGYIIRDEKVLKGEKPSNGLTQIITEGTRVAKDKAVFRYYNSNEEKILEQIEELDKQIDQALSDESDLQYSSDIANLELQIKEELDYLYKENDLQNVRECKKKINSYIVKKCEIAASLSPEGSYIRTLVASRTDLSNRLARRF